MQLLVVRHGIAEDANTWAASGQPELRRPLTDEGRRKMKKAARGLRAIVDRIELLATSPLTRAVQTAELIARVYDGVAISVTAALEPGREPQVFLEWLHSLDQVNALAIVGHEPHLTTLAGWLMSGRELHALELKKGGACLLELDPAAAPANAVLHWLLRPDQLRRLRK
jgi:phosphohistidine phosphatase